ncbi:TIGR00341 family protein [Pseudanabaena sp. PCC 6802]|uniref:TIGR00341 family protein n=1 Tax=Pseudanabaena sp. PCC 6802 TaxID=118173 RepID=UPI000348C94A|nr:TIGR00341 family protein [Pseudanabaena sp. PCC 6802]
MLERLHSLVGDFRRTRVEPDRLQQLQAELVAESTLDVPYLVLIVSSCAIATFGLLSNSAAVIIGAMVIAPLMLPIRGLAFGALVGDTQLFRRGLVAVTAGTLLALVISWGIGLLISLPSYGSEILARSKPNLLDLGIAVVAGGISGYAMVQPKISASLAGTAIAVALMPPVCTIGLGLAQANWPLSWGATLLYLTNLLGISLACMVTFLVTGYTPLKQARKALVWTLLLTGVLVVPLALSFFELIGQSRLEASLRKVLLNRTLTFQRVELLKSEINWLTSPPQVYLSVRAKEAITPKQVRLLEAFLEREMHQPFALIFTVSQVEEVRGDSSVPPPTNSKPNP